MTLQNLEKLSGEIKAHLHTLKTGTNARSAAMTRGNIYEKWNSMGNIFNRLAGGANGAKAAKIMDNTRKMLR
jgi:hypothetical protein